MLSYDNDLPLPVLVPMKTSFPSAKALKLSLGDVATLANEKLLERVSDNDLLLCRKSTSNKTRYRQ
jgi:hypothetical protein